MQYNNMFTERIDKAEKKLMSIEVMKKELLRGLTVFLLVEIVFLFLRILLKIIGSDPQALFVGFVYFVSDLLLIPFFNIVAEPQTSLLPGRASIDTTAIIAFFCYFIIILLAMCIVGIVATMLKTKKQKDETVEKNNLINPTKIDSIVK